MYGLMAIALYSGDHGQDNAVQDDWTTRNPAVISCLM